MDVNTTDDQNPTLTVNWTWGLAQGKDLYYPTLMSSTDGGVYTVFGYSPRSKRLGLVSTDRRYRRQ